MLHWNICGLGLAPPRNKPARVWLWQCALLLLLAAALRTPLLTGTVRFHPDEAFFAAFAQAAAARGEWLLTGNLDKTPLAIYAQALSFLAVGVQWDGAVWQLDAQRGEFAARLPAYYASLLLVALWAAWARQMHGTRSAGLWAAALLSLSPYAIAFAPTAFTDVPMLLCLSFSLYFAHRGRGVWAGVGLALAYGCKQQALLFVMLPPLLLSLHPRAVRRIIHYTLPLILGAALLAAWDAARPEASVWALAAANNTPDSAWTAPVQTWGARGAAWAWLSRELFGVGVLTGGVLLAAAVGVWRGGAAARMVALYALGYAVLHTVLNFNHYDRYVLPLLPLIALLAARTLPHMGRWLGAAALGLMLLAAVQASVGHPTLGGDKGQHAGIIALANDLNAREFGAIIYDRWLGWELNYYLGAWSDKRRAYYPTVEALLADEAPYLPDVAPRYLPAPINAPHEAWIGALGQAGFEVWQVYEAQGFVVYALRPPPR